MVELEQRIRVTSDGVVPPTGVPVPLDVLRGEFISDIGLVERFRGIDVVDAW